MDRHAIKMTWPMYLRGHCEINGSLIKMTRKEKEAFSFLLLRYPGIISNSEFIELIYPNPDEEPEDVEDSIRTLIWSLRKKIGNDMIRTEWGIGYRLNIFKK